MHTPEPSPSTLSDSVLLTRAQELCADERRITLSLLQHLLEIDRRQLHLERGFSSLFDYLVKELRYSEGAAFRRLQAMRALRDLPEVEPAIEKGSVNLTTVAQLQGFFQSERKESGKTYTVEEKRELLSLIENKSRREVEEVLVTLSPSYQSEPPEKERVVGVGQLQITFTADEELLGMLEKIRSLTSHVNPDPSYLELFKKMAEVTIKKLDPAREPSRPGKEGAEASPSPAASPENDAAGQAASVPAAVRRAVWQRDQGRCTYRDPETGQMCGSTFQVQLDHCYPRALGGEHSVLNCRLLCRNHNLHAAVRTFGAHKVPRAVPA